MKHSIENITRAALFSGMGIIIPILFHMVGLGAVFLPMFIPLSLGAYFLPAGTALMMGVITPLLSALLTGMPPFYPPMVFIMMAELGVMCIVISLLRGTTRLPVVIIQAIALLVDRLILVMLYALILPLFGVSFKVFTLASIAKSLPGIALLMVTVPFGVPAVEKVLKKKIDIYE